MSSFVVRDPLPALVAITSPLAGEGFLDDLVAHLAAVFDADRAFVAVPEVASVPRAQVLACRDRERTCERYAYELVGWPCEAVQRGEMLAVADGVRERYGAARSTRYESFLGVPLRDESGRIAGHLAVYAHAPRVYGPEALHVARIFGHRAEAELSRVNEEARRVALLDELRRVNEKLLRESVTDSLTGTYNRRYFDEACEREFHRARRYGRSFSIVALDIDHFKVINDTHGHHGGDEVLRSVAQTIRRTCRDRIDTLARIGGEEFALLAVETTTAVATLPERIRAAIEAQAVSLPSGDVRVTASIGMASMRAGDGAYLDVSRRADRALYDAKDAGRNRVRIADP